MGLGASALAATLWGFGGIFVVLTTISGLSLTFYRLWIGSVVLSVVLYASGRKLSVAAFSASWLAGVLLAADMAMIFSAFKLTSVVAVTVIGAFQPALVLIVARPLFKEEMRRTDFIWICLAIVGIFIVVLGQHSPGHLSIDGDFLALGALICWSAYWLVSKHARTAIGALEYTACVSIVAAISVSIVVLLSRQSLGGVDARDWLWIVVLSVVPGSGHLIMNWAHRYVDASVSSVVACLSPLVAAIAAMIFLGQSLTLLQVIGVSIGLAAVAIVAVRHQEPSTLPLN
jgi:drug/metabolite transporter (DMT)-like permease